MSITPGIRRAHRATASPRDRGRGQALAEFALILVPLMLIILGIIQMGFIFNAYVTISNAAREGAREGTIFVADQTASQASNDGARETRIRQAVRNTLGLLPDNLTDANIAITYANPDSEPSTASRKGWQVTVRVTYPLDLLIPFIGDMMPRDAGGRMPIIGEVTMVIN